MKSKFKSPTVSSKKSSYFKRILNEELRKIRTDVGNLQYISGKYEEAAKMFEQLSISNKLVDFLTLPAYRHIN